MTRPDTAPDTASRYLRALRHDVLALARTGATPDQLRTLAGLLSTAWDLARDTEITRDQAFRELADEAELAVLATLVRGAPPMLPPPDVPHLDDGPAECPDALAALRRIMAERQGERVRRGDGM